MKKGEREGVWWSCDDNTVTGWMAALFQSPVSSRTGKK